MLIFVGGVHGAGKSYFCDLVKMQLHINSYQSSQLISEQKNEYFSKDKKVLDIDCNQNYLFQAIKKLNRLEQTYLLDGHFCLQDINGKITRIDKQIYISLKPCAIVLLTEKSDIIVDRRKKEMDWM